MRWLDPCTPINWNSSLNRGLVSRWQAVPNAGGYGSKIWRDLCLRNHGTLTNGPTWQGAMGRPGGFGSLGFSGSTDYVEVPDHSSLEGMTQLTISGWVRADAIVFSEDQLVILQKGTDSQSGSIPYFWDTRASGNIACFINSTLPGGGNNWPAALVQDTWRFLTMVFNGSAGTLDLYNDGVIAANQSTAETSIATDAGALRFGDSAGGTDFNGNLDEFRIHNRAFSATEVSALYQDSLRGSPETLNWLRRVTVFDMGGAPPAANRRRRLLICGKA